MRTFKEDFRKITLKDENLIVNKHIQYKKILPKTCIYYVFKFNIKYIKIVKF